MTDMEQSEYETRTAGIAGVLADLAEGDTITFRSNSVHRGRECVGVVRFVMNGGRRVTVNVVGYTNEAGDVVTRDPNLTADTHTLGRYTTSAVARADR